MNINITKNKIEVENEYSSFGQMNNDFLTFIQKVAILTKSIEDNDYYYFEEKEREAIKNILSSTLFRLNRICAKKILLPDSPMGSVLTPMEEHTIEINQMKMNQRHELQENPSK